MGTQRRVVASDEHQFIRDTEPGLADSPDPSAYPEVRLGQNCVRPLRRNNEFQETPFIVGTIAGIEEFLPALPPREIKARGRLRLRQTVGQDG